MYFAKFFPLSLVLSSSILEKTLGAGSNKYFYEDQAAWSSVPADPAGSNQCDGTVQSPVNLNKDDYSCETLSKPYVLVEGDCTLDHYQFSIVDNGLKATLNADGCTRPTMNVPGTDKVYEVLQFHVHTGCENKFDGKGCDAELHIVHIAEGETIDLATANALDIDDINLLNIDELNLGINVGIDGSTTDPDALPKLAVLGFMMFGGDVAPNGELTPIIESWMEVGCSNQSNCVTVAPELKAMKFSPYQLVPYESGTNVYNFQGSLTTPPCWEVVNWNVVENPMLISFRQLLAISQLTNFYTGTVEEDGTSNTCGTDFTVADDAGLTAREIQPLNDREVKKICGPISIELDVGFSSENSAFVSGTGTTLDLGSTTEELLNTNYLSILGI